ncbi:hypothetical protein SK128_010130 [Halocaridina rubra]|uniref:MADF domain-containing protein n=1 Tax=Halocaridina rubra TaxID=373956 RepID=A0AAN9A7G1_HALRR
MENVASPLDIKTEGPPGSTIVLHTPTTVDVFAGHPSDVDVKEEEEGDHVVQPTTQEEEEQETQQQQPGDESELDFSRPGSRSEGSSHEDPSQYRPTGCESIVFSPRQEANLVEWLQQHPYLYDKVHVLYRDKERKKRAFQEKGATLVPPVSGKELEKWFASRRTQFGRITRKIMTTGQPHLTHREKFVLKHFEFLRPHIARHRDTQVLGTPEAGGANLHASTVDVGEGVAGPSCLGGGPSVSSAHRRTCTVSRGSQTEEDEEDEDEEVARVEHTTRPKRKSKPDRPSTASTSSAAGPKEQEEIGRTLTGMGTPMSNYGKIVGNVSTMLGEDDKRTQFWRTTLTEPIAQVLGMSVDVDMYGEVNRTMHEVLNHFVKATRDRKEAARQATEFPSPVTTTQPALF